MPASALHAASAIPAVESADFEGRGQWRYVGHARWGVSDYSGKFAFPTDENLGYLDQRPGGRLPDPLDMGSPYLAQRLYPVTDPESYGGMVSAAPSPFRSHHHDVQPRSDQTPSRNDHTLRTPSQRARTESAFLPQDLAAMSQRAEAGLLGLHLRDATSSEVPDRWAEMASRRGQSHYHRVPIPVEEVSAPVADFESMRGSAQVPLTNLVQPHAQSSPASALASGSVSVTAPVYAIAPAHAPAPSPAPVPVPTPIPALVLQPAAHAPVGPTSGLLFPVGSESASLSSPTEAAQTSPAIPFASTSENTPTSIPPIAHPPVPQLSPAHPPPPAETQSSLNPSPGPPAASPAAIDSDRIAREAEAAKAEAEEMERLRAERARRDDARREAQAAEMERVRRDKAEMSRKEEERREAEEKARKKAEKEDAEQRERAERLAEERERKERARKEEEDKTKKLLELENDPILQKYMALAKKNKEECETPLFPTPQSAIASSLNAPKLTHQISMERNDTTSKSSADGFGVGNTDDDVSAPDFGANEDDEDDGCCPKYDVTPSMTIETMRLLTGVASDTLYMYAVSEAMIRKGSQLAKEWKPDCPPEATRVLLGAAEGWMPRKDLHLYRRSEKGTRAYIPHVPPGSSDSIAAAPRSMTMWTAHKGTSSSSLAHAYPLR
ncbi:hypothetical protein BDK51DRAFT_38327 [Blyttiomyces helicus]|uniref:Uncharacterized protein n=1 Tax=Blyttiomyces helicus TaxID=388810 RepID=A0A4P9WN20_9FUNG|nr:hypothetical protein BDK51DRAFT_38327 [Blyttiomyces helicus]|eukprot:RKO94479.1 hypothetical protein BDK51DRAFT_38327 [Blyttiomyces helicus]